MSERSEKENPHIDAIVNSVLLAVSDANKHIKSTEDATQFTCLFLGAIVPVLMGPYGACPMRPKGLSDLEAVMSKVVTAGANAMMHEVRKFKERN